MWRSSSMLSSARSLDPTGSATRCRFAGKICGCGPERSRASPNYSGHYWQIDRLGQSGSEVESVVMRSRSLWDGVLKLPIDVPLDGEIHHHRIIGRIKARLSVVERVVLLKKRHNPCAWSSPSMPGKMMCCQSKALPVAVQEF